MTIYLIIVNFLLAFKLGWDWYAREKQNRVINHARSLIIDGVVYVASAWFLFGFSILSLIVVLTTFIYRGTFFDLLYNLIFKNKWSYCGENSDVDKFLDKIDGKDDDDCVVGFAIKVFILIIGVSLIIMIKQGN